MNILWSVTGMLFFAVGAFLLLCRPDAAPAGADPKQNEKHRKELEEAERRKNIFGATLVLLGALLIWFSLI